MALETRFTRSGSSLLYNGRPARLAGIYPPKIGPTPPVGIEALDVDPNPSFDALRIRKNNYFRFPMLAYYHYDEPGFAYSPYFRDTNGKWKLDSFNSNYFDRLRAMISKAAAHGLAVQITLFESKGLDTANDAAQRWPVNPWKRENNYFNFIVDEQEPPGGIPEFYDVNFNPKLKELQALFIQHVVALTKDFWNVFYEIMNEPGGMPASQPRRVSWADWVTGEITKETLGQRLIFYNDFSNVNAGGPGGDVNYWKAHRATLPNYDRLDGVIFHGDPANTNPNDAHYAFRGEKIFLVSTDAYGSQDDAAINTNRATTALNAGMPYQGESLSLDVASAFTGLNLTVLA
jgi:hypothetical protein